MAQAPWENPPLGLWRGGVPICDLFGVNKTPTKVDDLQVGRDLWSSVEIASVGYGSSVIARV